VAEIELSVLTSQCLNRRIADIELMRKEVAAWELDRNHRSAAIDWRFTTEDARIKLKRIYPKSSILHGASYFNGAAPNRARK
jgi:hypothetical protein